MLARFDSVRLDAVERTTSGALRAPAVLTRAGVFSYTDPTGKVFREWRPEEEVHRADSMATLEDVPVTIGHPPQGMRPELFAARAVGHVRASSVRKDEATAGVASQVIVARADAIGKAERRELCDISSGYEMRLDETPGVVPAGHVDAGKAYDRVQRDIRYNHVALLPKGGGRLGTQCGLRLDSAGAQIADEDTTMIRIDGKDYQGEAAQAAVDQTIANAKAGEAREKARADAAEAKLAKIEADQASAARNALIAQAKTILGEAFAGTRADAASASVVAMTEREIKVAVLGKLDPAFRADGRPDAYVDVRFDLAIEAQAKAGAKRADARPEVAKAIVDLNAPKTAPTRADAGDVEPNPNTHPREYAAYHEARALRR